jgi:hypothetical protein
MKNLIKDLMTISPMLPGTLEKRYNVCGKLTCACKDKVNPKKHGPYYRLSFSVKGKNSSIFVKASDADLVRQMTEAYKAHRNAPIELGLEFADLCKELGFEDAYQGFMDSLIDVKRELGGFKAGSVELRECKKSQTSWKDKAIERRKELVSKNVKITNLSDSRDNWKEKYQQEKGEKTIAQNEIKILTSKLKEKETQISEHEKKNS